MIDWFTVIAQIVNFLILVALLKFFLYGRIVRAMSDREDEIAARWDEAERQRSEAAKELEEAQERNRQFDAHREQLMAKARDDVEVRRQQLTAKVRDEVGQIQARWSDSIREETESFLRDLRRRTSEEVCNIARQALADLADAELEQQIVAKFMEQIDELGNDQRTAVIASLDGDHQSAVVQTSRELPPDLQSAVTETLRRRLRGDLKVRFEQSPDLLCGIVLQTDSHKLAWDLRDYLSSLEQQLRHTLEEETFARRSNPAEAVNVVS